MAYNLVLGLVAYMNTFTDNVKVMHNFLWGKNPVSVIQYFCFDSERENNREAFWYIFDQERNGLIMGSEFCHQPVLAGQLSYPFRA